MPSDLDRHGLDQKRPFVNVGREVGYGTAPSGSTRRSAKTRSTSRRGRSIAMLPLHNGSPSRALQQFELFVGEGGQTGSLSESSVVAMCRS